MGLLLCLEPVAQAASASQSPDTEDRSDRPVLLERPLVTPRRGGETRGQRAVWFWRSGGRIFTVGDINNTQIAFTGLYAYDDQTFKQVGRLSFPPNAAIWTTGRDAEATAGMPHTMTVDEAGGRLFILGTTETHSGQNGKQAEAVAGWPSGSTCRAYPPTTQGRPRAYCATSIHVVNAASLEHERSIDLAPLRVDGMLTYPIPRALRYEPPRGSESAGKLLGLFEEGLLESAVLASADTGPRQFGLNQAYAVQFDADTGALDWIVRLEPCNSRREIAVGDTGWGPLPFPAAIFASPRDGAVWIGCHSGGTQVGTIMRLPLDDAGRPLGVIPAPDADRLLVLKSPTEPQQPEPPTFDEGASVFVGPERVASILADPASERMVMRTLQRTGAETWMVFDGRHRAFLGRVGTGDRAADEGYYGVDQDTGRLYVLHPTGEQAGLFVTDLRSSPLQQALYFPEFAGVRFTDGGLPISVRSGTTAEQWPRLFYPTVDAPLGGPEHVLFHVIEDRIPVQASAGAVPGLPRSLNIDEVEGATSATFDGAARGFGARMILLGGVEATSRIGLASPLSWGRALWYYPNKPPPEGADVLAPARGFFGLVPHPEQCTPEDREVILAFVGADGPAIVDRDGARGGAVAFQIDGSTATDVQAPASRCQDVSWEQAWTTALFGRPPVAEPGAGDALVLPLAECTSSSTKEEAARTGDAVTETYAAAVSCDRNEAQGFGYVRGVSSEDVSVAEALSSFRIYRDPGRGVVSRVESVARGVRVGGVLRIETVRGTAESWANGREQPVPEEAHEAGYAPNCDFERSAGTCFQRHLFGVWTPGWSCGPCGDEDAFVAGVNRSLSTFGRIAFRNPDPLLARGSADGFIAAVQRSDAERFSDLTLNNDLLPTVVPVLELVRYANAWGLNQTADYTSYQDRSGRQVYQFAGVEVSSSYGIQCLLVYDEATNTCAAAQEPPAALTLRLEDPDGKPLAGGGFEVRRDTDADGVAGLADELVPEGACVTADDGTGTCAFKSLSPGHYLVSQLTAPPGHAPVEQPYAVELLSGEERTVTFTNASNLAAIEVTAEDQAGKPLAGARFGAYPDPDADGKVAPGAEPAGECVTGTDGRCRITVPTGAYVLVQLAAPAGLEPVEPVAFALTSGGQVAAVGVVNFPPRPQGGPAAPPPAAAPEIREAPRVLPAPTLDVTPLPPLTSGEEPPPAGPGVDLGGTVERVVRGPADVLRLLVRQPAEGAAFAATLLLLLLAWAAVARRRAVVELVGQPRR